MFYKHFYTSPRY